MSRVNSMGCCGIKEIQNICDNSNPETTIEEVCREFFEEENKCAFFTFSDIERKTYGRNLEKYIKEHKLGKTIKTNSKINPNSDNSLKIWVWEINRKNLRKFWYKNENE